MITDVFFDFFGTLVSYTHGPSAKVEYSESYRCLQAAGIDSGYREFMATLNRVFDELEAEARSTNIEYRQRDASSRLIARITGEEAPTMLVNDFTHTFATEWNRGTRPIPGVDEFLSRLSTRFRLSVISNTHYPPLVPGNLEAMRIRHHFATVVTSVDFGIRKPDPRIFQEALRRVGATPDATVYVGDNPVDDYDGARRAGLRAILIDPDGRWEGRAAERVSSLFDVAGMLPH